MSTIALALNTLLICLIIFPFISILGAAWIEAYFKTKMKYENERGVDFINRLKKNNFGKGENKDVQKNL